MTVTLQSNWARSKQPRLAFKTRLGRSFRASIEEFLESADGRKLRGKVDLILTSPPFPLASPKSYGNKSGEDYLKWLSGLALPLGELLSPEGSLVLEIGNSWDKGSPTMSTLPFETLIALKKAAGLHVCQQFICNNPNRLPSPVVYVNKERCRVKDSYTHVWWYGVGERPYADNRNILQEYSPAMKKLLDRQSYNAGQRPSEHVIGETSFLTNNGGSIPSNSLEVGHGHRFRNWLEFTGSSTDQKYASYCKRHGLTPHPARMQSGLVEFFVRFLSRKNALIFDPFAGSNTTGAIAEALGRRWVSTEKDHGYVRGSVGRFS
jgi:site-specific DNA-methyltransferase (cytosine-N4-specific)